MFHTAGSNKNNNGSAADRAQLDGFLKQCKLIDGSSFCRQSLKSSMTLILFSLLAYVKTVKMFCTHFCLIIPIYNINLGNVHITRS